MAFKLSAPTAVFGMIATGTICSLLAKLIYSVEGVNRYGEVARFEKPWFQVLAMFFGMSLCILLDLPKPGQSTLPNGAPGGDTTGTEMQPLLSSSTATATDDANGDAPREREPSVWIVSVPTLLDLFATACGTTGLLYTTVSVYQMLRGAMLVWTALMSVLFLRRTLSGKQWGGIFLCVGGIILVGVANILGEDAGKARDNVALGVGIILVGQILQAGQVVLEEYMLQDLRMSSVRIVAYEGLFGVFHCLLWVFPLLMVIPGRDHGKLEDIFDAFYMLVHSWKVAAVVLGDATLMLFYNVFGMEVTENLSAVHRVVIETLRTLCVWVADLLIYYVFSNGTLGEAWTKYSVIQLLGFALLIVGTLVYNYDNLMADYKMRQKKKSASAGDVLDAPSESILDPSFDSSAPISSASEVKPARKKIVAIAVGGESDDDDDNEVRSSSLQSIHALERSARVIYEGNGINKDNCAVIIELNLDI